MFRYGALISEAELIMGQWKIEKSADTAMSPVDKAGYRKSRAGIHVEIFRMQEKMFHLYDPVALEEMENRISKLYAIINDLNKVLNA